MKRTAPAGSDLAPCNPCNPVISDSDDPNAAAVLFVQSGDLIYVLGPAYEETTA